VAITDIIGVSQLSGHVPGLLPQVYAYEHRAPQF